MAHSGRAASRPPPVCRACRERAAGLDRRAIGRQAPGTALGYRNGWPRIQVNKGLWEVTTAGTRGEDEEDVGDFRRQASRYCHRGDQSRRAGGCSPAAARGHTVRGVRTAGAAGMAARGRTRAVRFCDGALESKDRPCRPLVDEQLTDQLQPKARAEYLILSRRGPNYLGCLGNGMCMSKANDDEQLLYGFRDRIVGRTSRSPTEIRLPGFTRSWLGTERRG